MKHVERMKRIATAVIALVLIAALAMAALAETMYVTENGVKVYAENDKGSKVLKKFDGNDKINVTSYGGEWSQVSVKVKGKSKTGWIQSKYLSSDPVQSRCKHKWGDWKVEKKATCTSTGYRVRYCKKCGIMEEGDIKKADHKYGDWKVTKKATCTKEGEKQRTCKVCGHVQTKAIAKTDHKYGDWKVEKKATCTRKGVRVRTCKECKHQDREDYLAPHTYGDWEIIRAATCEEAGLRERECGVCGHVEEKTISKLPHDFEDRIIVAATDHSAGTRRRVCRACGYAEPERSYDPEGTLRRGSKGDEVRAIQQLLIDQGYLKAGAADGSFGGGTEKAVIKFQKDQGLNPDGVVWPQTRQRLQHDFGPWETVKPLTRTEPGERVRVCRDCGYEQRETFEAGSVLERGRKGEDVRAVQKMLGQLGFNPGKADGAYGKKLDAAFADFARAKGLTFEAGRIRPGDLDALVGAWIDEASDAAWKGESGNGDPVNLALAVTAEGEGDGDVRTFSWTLTNLGSESCTFNALLLSSGSAPDFRHGALVMEIEGFVLKPDGGNSASGRFSVSNDWVEGRLNFAALAVIESTGERWLSNTVSFGE